MAGFRKALTTAMGLKDDAALGEIHESFIKMLSDDMSEAELAAPPWLKDKMDEKDKNKADSEKETAEKAAAAELAESLKTLRGTLGLSEKATLKECAEAAAKIKASDKPSETALALEIKSLSERLELAEKSAAKAEVLEKQAKIDSRERYLSDQVRAGKLVPAEKDFYTKMWEADEAAVRKYFDEKKGTVVRLAERGSDLPGMEFTDRDPREEMRELAEKRASEKGIDFNVALTQVKGEKPELVERIASMYGPPTR